MPEKPRQIGWLGRLIGLDVAVEQIAAKIDELERLLPPTAADTAALEEAREILRVADETIDKIEP